MLKSVVAILATVLSIGHAHAKPAPAGGDPAAAAAKLAADARAANDRAMFVACGTAYLDVYNADPTAARADEALYNAAVCFTEARSIGAAIMQLQQLRRSFPRSRLAPQTLARLAVLHGEIASYAEAASLLEEYARKYPGEKDAADALRDAIAYRLAYGSPEKAIDDVALFKRQYGAKRPRDAAEAHLALVGHFERLGGDPLIAHLRAYLRDHAPKGDPTSELVVRARLGEALWHRACPVKEVEGLCVKVERDRAAPPPPKTTKTTKATKTTMPPIRTQCSSRGPRLAVVPRDAALLMEAQRSFVEVQALGAKGALDPRGRYHVARSQRLRAERDLEAFLAVPFPTGLDFTPGKSRTRTSKRFDAFLEHKKRLGGAATAGFEAVLAHKDPTSSVAAAARIATISQAFATSLVASEIPISIRTGEHAADKVAAYCDTMTEVAAPLDARAVRGFQFCLEKGSEFGIADGFTRMCAREHDILDPKFGWSAPDRFANPPPPVAIAVAPPLVSKPTLSPPTIAIALAKFALYEQGGWTPATCRTSAAQFAAIAKKNPTFVDVQYMAGLSLHRCGLVDDARREYEATLKLRANHAATLANLAELSWRAGNRDVAKRGWEAAVAADPQQYAARVSLAAIGVAEWRALPAPRPRVPNATWEQLRSALAIDPAPIAAHVALAMLELDNPVAARAHLGDVQKRGGGAQLLELLALGAGAAHREDWPLAIAQLEAAVALAPSSAEAHLALGLAYLRVLRFEGGRAQLVLVTTPSYDLHVGRGVALRWLGKTAEAIAAFDQAIALAPKRFDAHFDLGLLHARDATKQPDVATAKAAHARAAAAYRRAADVGTAAEKAEATLRADEADRTIVQLDAAKAPKP